MADFKGRKLGDQAALRFRAVADAGGIYGGRVSGERGLIWRGGIDDNETQEARPLLNECVSSVNLEAIV